MKYYKETQHCQQRRRREKNDSNEDNEENDSEKDKTGNLELAEEVCLLY